MIEEWQAWRTHGAYPRAGGWEEQPLDKLIAMSTVEMVYSTRRFLLQKGSDWEKLNATQRALIHWLRDENG